MFGRFVKLAVLGECVKIRDSCLNRYPDIRREAVGGGSFDRFVNFDNCQPEVASDVISGTAIQNVGMDILANFGDSK